LATSAPWRYQARETGNCEQVIVALDIHQDEISSTEKEDSMTDLTAQGNAIVATASTAVATVLKEGGEKLQQAIDIVKSLGLRGDVRKPQAIVSIIEEIKDADPDLAYFIARTLSEQEAFDDLVVQKISGIAVGDDYKEITAAFDSIRADAKKAVLDAADGNESIWGKITGFFKEATQGDIADRFSKIEDRFEQVTTTLAAQLKGEKEILEAYQLFRGALGQSQVAALAIKANLEATWNAAKEKAETAQKAVDDAQAADEATKVSLQIARDSANDARSKAEGQFDIGKDLADNLMIAYNITEVTMKKLEGTSKLKDRIYKRSVSFYAANRSTLASLKANYNATIGLAEGTNALDSMTGGINRSLSDLADVSGEVNAKAIRSGYGKTIDADVVKTLAEALLVEDEENAKLIEQSRAEASQNADEIRTSVEDVKRRYAATANKIAA
jgi:hypothetical protein